MLLVVLGHVKHGAEGQLAQVIYKFHMPLFMCISGYLFYMTGIAKVKRYTEIIAEKSSRLLIPYFAFSIATIIPKVVFSEFMHRSASFSLSQLADAFVWLTNMPLAEMWFLNSLFFLFLLYPVYVLAIKNEQIGILVLLVLLTFYFAKPKIPSFVFDFRNVCAMGVFFYIGILAAKIHICDKVQRPKVWLILHLIAFFVLYKWAPVSPVSSFVIALVGISASTLLCISIAGYSTEPFRSFRDYTYQIFLMGIFFQIAVRIFVAMLPFEDIAKTAVLYLASVALGIYAPVMISKICLKMNSGLAKKVLGLR